MKYILSILLVGIVLFTYTSCKKIVQKSHFTYYFIENKTGSPIRVNASLKSSETEFYCDNCIIDDNKSYQLAGNITTVGDIAPSETFSKISFYRNDSLKLVLQDSTLFYTPWVKITTTQTLTDYKLVITNL